MNRRTLISLAAVSALGITLTGCTTRTMRPAPQRAFAKENTLENIRAAILEAARAMKWEVIEDNPEKQEIVLSYPPSTNLRSQEINATVRVPYTVKGYSIEFVSERGLNMRDDPNQAGQKLIHRKYNAWVERLDVRIMLELNRRRN